MGRIIKWGILATGNIANQFARGLELVPNAMLWAVGSRDRMKAESFASEFGAHRAYGSYLEVAQDNEVDAIYVATPHTLHYQNTMMCLEHGKAVLCEKPFAMDYSQVSSMIALARAKRVFLMEAMWTRFLPSIIRVMELVQQGTIGNIVLIKSDFGIRPPFDPSGRLFNRELGGGSLLDIGIYPMFISLLLMGEPEGIAARARIGSTQVDESTSMILTYSSGAQAVLYSSIAAETANETDVYGTLGRIRIHRFWHMPNAFTLTLNDGTSTHFPHEPKGNGYEYEAMEVTRCLLEGRVESPLMPLSFSEQLIRLLDRVRAECGIHYD